MGIYNNNNINYRWINVLVKICIIRTGGRVRNGEETSIDRKKGTWSTKYVQCFSIGEGGGDDKQHGACIHTYMKGYVCINKHICMQGKTGVLHST